MEYTLKRFNTEIKVDEYIRDYVDVPKFLKFCQECRDYNKKWSCPNFHFDPMDIWNSYETLKIEGYDIFFTGERTSEEMIEVLYKVKRDLLGELFAKEAAYPNSLALSAGNCQLCAKCARLTSEPCRLPNLMRHSIEALGGDVEKTISQLCGIKIEWIDGDKLTDHLVLAGGLLLDHK